MLLLAGSYFSELQYSPDGAVTRNTISDAESVSNRRKERFDNRQRRTQFNIETSKSRVELEEMLTQVLRDRRAENIAKTNLKYVSKLYLDDLKGYKKIPLENMQKRFNKEMFAFTWGDHQNSDKPDDRDFKTTAESSYACASTSPVSDTKIR